MKRWYIVLFACFAAAPFGALAQTSSTMTDSSNVILTRVLDLAEIGFQNGVEFEQLSGGATFFFPTGTRDAIDEMSLVLDYVSGQTIPVERNLQVRVSGQVMHVERIDGETSRGRIEIELDRDAIQSGFVEVGIDYAGASSESICIDERASGDFLRIEPSTRIILSLDRAALDDVARVADVMPPRKRLVTVPSTSADRALSFALRAAAAYDAEAGMITFESGDSDSGDSWTSTTIRLSSTETGGVGGAQVSVTNTPKPGLLFEGKEPSLGFDVIGSPWGPLSSGATYRIDGSRSTQDTITFADLNIGTLDQLVTGSTTFDISASIDAFPVGQIPMGVQLLIAAARSVNGQGVTASAYMNGTLLGSRPLDNEGPTWMSFTIPAGLVVRDNQIEVLVQRQIEGGSCRFGPQGYPAQIFPESRFILGKAPDPIDDFFLLRQAFGNGLDVVLGEDVGAQEAMPWLLPVAGAILPDAVVITPQSQIIAPVDGDRPRPFLYVGFQAPAGADAKVRFDQGRVEVRDNQGSVLFNGEMLNDVGLVQIVEVNGRSGLWLRPGAGAPPAPTPVAPLLLDRGDLAFISSDGVQIVTSTRRASLIDVVYPERFDAMQLIATYRPWIVGALWIALTLIVIRFLQGVYHRAGRGKKS
ncbi:hypothetical protein EU805_12615 [Salipiger sp. IMCC34102]|uniref:cellulose biosynthesis cyclic di-GMP-binding regulatory protein BcsB n=1 Tax=Salipiger sp. IMCC34102 TaxID=2510647 RepID=UPI00101C230B|nr:cellulose biosynthesis cyclic di-GMP-binding regulatory protein BcsB [Salipiger sp. IMCC34102]RYH02017.1 hypothetical protein EU805_12615 [Salipiger sp. IMCC34102]